MHVLEPGVALREFRESVRTQRLAESADKLYLESKLKHIITESAPEIWISGVRYSTVIEVGDVEEKILAVAKQIGVQMIVLGFVGLKGVRKVRALGSMSKDLIERSEIPMVSAARG